jgi:hypothetical protein
VILYRSGKCAAIAAALLAVAMIGFGQTTTVRTDRTYVPVDLANRPVSGNILPSADGTLSVGSASLRWNLKIKDVDVSGSMTGNLVPVVNSAQTLGDSAHRWHLYADAIESSGANSFSGRTATKDLNSVRYADQFPGSDIGAKVNAAFGDCLNTCTVYVPAGSYNYSTSISYPMAPNGAAALVLAPGARLTYTGSSYAIDAQGSGESKAGVTIVGEGATLTGTSSGLAGIRLRAFNGALIRGLRITGFSTAPCILNEGANVVTIENSTLDACQDGLKNTQVSVSGRRYSANAVHVIGGYIVLNRRWGVWEAGSRIGTNLDNVYRTTFEANGTNGCASDLCGHAFVQSGNGIAFNGSYFEYGASSTVSSAITIGDRTYSPAGTIIMNSHFGSVGATNTILNTSGQGTIVKDNIETGSIPNFLNNGSSARLLQLGQTRCGRCTNIVTGSDNGADSEVLAKTAVFINARHFTPGGQGFNSITGNAQDLDIRKRSGGSHILNLKDSDGATRGSIDGNGKAVFNGGVAVEASGNVAIIAGTGGPKAHICTASTLGMIYLNKLGGTNTTLYVCTAVGTWTPK